MSAVGEPQYVRRSELIEMFEGDAEFVDDLAAQFTAQCRVALNDMNDALAARDLSRVSRLAHALKGSVAYFDPGYGQAILRTIERISPDQPERLRSLVNALETRMERLTRHLAVAFPRPAASFAIH